MLKNKIFWRLSLKTHLEDWVFVLSTGHENCMDKSLEGNHIDSPTSMFGLHQVTPVPAHILSSQSSSCIDLSFTDKPHLVTDCGIHASLHPNCHYQISYCKLISRSLFHLLINTWFEIIKKASSIFINKTLQKVIWDVLLHLKSVHEQVNVFNDAVINIFSNFILNKTIPIDDRDPPWRNEFLRNKIKQKNKAFRLFKNNRMGDNLSKLQNLSPDLSELTTERKEDYNCVPLPINLMICNHHQTFSGKSLKSFTMGTRYHEYLQL